MDATVYKYGILQSLELRRTVSPDASGYEISITLRKTLDHSSSKTMISFEGAASISIGKIDGLVIAMIAIIPIHNRQYENLKYEVRDVENEMLSFFCKSFLIDDGESAD